MSEEKKGLLGLALGLALVFSTVLHCFWAVFLLAVYGLVWGGDAYEAWQWRRIRKSVRNSLAYDDLL